LGITRNVTLPCAFEVEHPAIKSGHELEQVVHDGVV
jgi:hypothetical protein